MPQSYILAIDEGTTNAKAITVTKEGQILSKGSHPLSLFHPYPGWAEQDPEAIWAATKSAIAACLQSVPREGLAGIAISNQRESVLVWDRETGKALSPLISWQCHRSVAICEAIAARPLAVEIQPRTGAVIDPLYPASKIKWLLANLDNGIERAARGALCVGTVDTWLVWKLTGGQQFVTDFSNASRYQLFNINTLEWDHLLLDLYEIPIACLPQVIPSNGIRGHTVALDEIPAGVPLIAQAGDSHAALYGQGGFMPGVVKATYGTGSSLMVRVDRRPEDALGVCSTIAWHDGTPHLALEGNITHTGSAVKFISSLLGIADVNQLSEMAFSVPDTNGVYFVPALAGLGAPYWDASARGLISGLTDAATPAHIARAGFEAIAYQIADLLLAMEQASGMTLTQLSVDGGPTRNRQLMQFQADVLQKKIVRREIAEVSALGAAFLGGRTLGWWKTDQALAQVLPPCEDILPGPQAERTHQTYQLWKQAIKRTRFHCDD